MLTGTFDPACVRQPALSGTSRITRSGPAPGFRAKSATIASNNSFATVSDWYQWFSPVVAP